MRHNTQLTRKRWLPVAALSGLSVLILLAILRPGPEISPDATLAPLVDVVVAKEQAISPQINGFGRAQPQESWSAISEVTGRVIYRHPDLEKGRSLPAGTIVIRIDPVDYELAVAQSRSNLKSAELEHDRVNLNKRSLEQSLTIEKGRLTLAQKELKRKTDLKQRGLVSSSELEAQRSTVLVQEKAVWDLQSKLALIPTDRDVATANVKVAQAKLKEAERSLSRTNIVLPFDARIGSVNVELDQVVNVQQILLEAHDMNLMEVTANMSLSDMRRLMSATSGPTILPGQRIPDIRNLSLDAEVVLEVGNTSFSWNGKVDRIDDSIDSAANTIGLTAIVSNNLPNLDPRRSPPLLKDMYVNVKVTGKGKTQVAIPSKAIHGDTVYVVNKQSEIIIRTVEVLFEQNQLAVINNGIEPGDTVVVSDILNPRNGMRIRIAEAVVEVQL